MRNDDFIGETFAIYFIFLKGVSKSYTVKVQKSFELTTVPIFDQ